jgi:hypothetical protein
MVVQSMPPPPAHPPQCSRLVAVSTKRWSYIEYPEGQGCPGSSLRAMRREIERHRRHSRGGGNGCIGNASAVSVVQQQMVPLELGTLLSRLPSRYNATSYPPHCTCVALTLRPNLKWMSTSGFILVPDYAGNAGQRQDSIVL